MDGFDWYFYEKPFDQVLPWFAGAFYGWEGKRLEVKSDPQFLAEFETDQQYFRRVGRSAETIKNLPFQI